MKVVVTIRELTVRSVLFCFVFEVFFCSVVPAGFELQGSSDPPTSFRGVTDRTAGLCQQELMSARVTDHSKPETRLCSADPSIGTFKV